MGPRALRGIGLFAALSLSSCGATDGEDARPNLVLVVADTLRADYLGCYGFDGDVSPNLDRFAEGAVVFEHCFTQAPWTKPATASLLTSLYPEVHGLTDHEGGFWSASADRRTGALPSDALTLAEVLRSRGYRTAAFTANTWLAREYGFDQGFEVYDDYAARLNTTADELIANARRWLDHSDAGRPFFLYLHFMDVHAPYGAGCADDAARADFDALLRSPSLGADAALEDSEAPYNRWNNIEVRPEWATDAMRHRVAYWRARYAAGVRAFDRRFLELVRDLSDDTVFVVTSDHGEHLFEHGDWSHGQNLFDHQLRIPLIVRPASYERASGHRVAELVELVDVMPTVLALLGVEPPRGLQGRDLSGALRGEALDAGRAVFATGVQREPGLRSVRTATHKLIVDLEDERAWLYALDGDPREQVDLAARDPERARELRARLDAHLEAMAARGAIDAEAADVSEETRRRLEALGYQ